MPARRKMSDIANCENPSQGIEEREWREKRYFERVSEIRSTILRVSIRAFRGIVVRRLVELVLREHKGSVRGRCFKRSVGVTVSSKFHVGSSFAPKGS